MFYIIESDNKGWDGWFSIVNKEIKCPDLAFATITYSGGGNDWSKKALKQERSLAKKHAQMIIDILNNHTVLLEGKIVRI